MPPATPTAVAPMATAGPLTLDAALLTVPTTPPLPDPFWLAALRLGDEPPLRLRFALPPPLLRLEPDLRCAGFRAVDLLPLPERDDADLDRDPPPEAGFARLLDELLLGLRLACEELLDERVLLCPPPDEDLVAILSSPFENVLVVTRPTRRVRGAIGCSR